MYKTILIPTDGSNCSDQAVQEGLQLAKDVKAQVTFLYVLEDHVTSGYVGTEFVPYMADFYELDKKAGQETLERAVQQALEQGVNATQVLVERQDPATAILAASKNVDLIVIATHGRRGFNRFIFGSVAESVIRQSSVPCLIVRTKENDSESRVKDNQKTEST